MKKKIEIFDTISFTPFGTLACPPRPTSPCNIHLLDEFSPPLPPSLPCAFMSSVPSSFEEINKSLLQKKKLYGSCLH